MPRIVLITGGTSGIGRATAQLFAAAGAEVTITGRSPGTVEATAKSIGARGIACDGTDPEQIAALAEQFTHVDVLVNAAGGLADPPTDGLSPMAAHAARWRADLELNLLSAVLTTTAFQEKLAEGSAVISIGSIGAERRGGSYGAAKAALSAWHTFLSAQLAPRGVTSNVIAAGFVDETNFFGGALSDARRTALVEETHNKRPGTPADIAETAFFLASPGARHITGQTLHVNGGAHTTR
ncbi:SDR family NAD(P)-dependent oxidoreductase [Streptomyces avicenniae]|uniref:SDR family NAD(P)-dependent oxidoreductase n=1 Tax=Streptomyces avicenniae TaxID=500153 RepID=UPI00069B694A|nr:SDR family oxidoreductase [Streptomyces avicenniae]